MNGVLYFITFALACTALGLFLSYYYIEGFNDMNFSLAYPKMGDAATTGWFRTMGRECKPNLFKCKVNQGAQAHYFCSKNPNCEIPEYNVRGIRMKEPMSWFDRFV